MSSVLNRQRASGSGAQGGDGFIIENSLRFNDNDSAYLSFTKGAPTDGSKGVMGVWLKRANISLSAISTIVYGSPGESTRIEITNGTDVINIADDGVQCLETKQVFRDPTAWFHLLLSYDSDEGTAANRLKMFLNGVEITSFAADGRSNIASGEEWGLLVNSGVQQWGLGAGAGTYWDGYMAQAFIIDGTSIQNGDYTIDDFCPSDTNGNPIPIDIVGVTNPTFGNNGSLLDFAIGPGTGNGAGEDVSGNNNDFSESGFAANDKMSDSPTDDIDNGIGNYCTLSPITKSSASTFSNGNLDQASGDAGCSGTLYANSGKWYWEVTLNAEQSSMFGICEDTGVVTSTGDQAAFCNAANGFGFYGDSSPLKINQAGSTTSYGTATKASGSIFQIFWDADNGAIWFGSDDTIHGGANRSEIEAGTTTNAAFTGITGNFTAMDYSRSSASRSHNFGQQAFTYAVPSGFYPFNTSAFPAPAVKDASSSFTTHGYTGTGSAHDEIFGNNTSMDPDLVIIKNRDTTDPWNWVDSVRGATKELNSNSTAIESTDADGVDDLGVTDGFGLGSGAGGYNDNGEDFISYNWKAGGDGSSNTDGSINTTKTSVNAAAGFSISTYTGTGSNATIGHGLNNAPKWVVIKKFSGSVDSWHVYHAAQASDPQTDYLVLDTNAALVDSATVWNDTAPTSSVVSLGTDAGVNASSVTYIAYCWEEIEGFSKFGVFTGTSDANGPLVPCNFAPSLVIIKRTDAARVWRVHDNTKLISGNDAFLELNDVTADQDSSTNASTVDFLSNGFKIRGNSSHQNTGNLVFMAFADTPSGEGVSQARAR